MSKRKLFKVTVASGWHDHDKSDVLIVATTEQRAIDAAIKFYSKHNDADNSFHRLEIMAVEEEYGMPLPLVIVNEKKTRFPVGQSAYLYFGHGCLSFPLSATLPAYLHRKGWRA